MGECIFCKIATGEFGTQFLYEDDQVVAFRDINPVAPVHILVVPKEHIPSADGLTEAHNHLIGHIFQVIRLLAKQENLKNGYRVVNNCGKDAGQTVGHIHFHLLGGRSLHWPPG